MGQVEVVLVSDGRTGWRGPEMGREGGAPGTPVVEELGEEGGVDKDKVDGEIFLE